MDNIGGEATRVMLNMIHNLLSDYQQDMNKGYLAAGDDPFKVSLGLKLEPGARGIDIEASISFVTGRIKDKTTGTANESQQGLFDEAKRTHLELKPETIEIEE